MPTYEYRCPECGFHFERMQNMSDEPVRECPICSGTVERIIGAGSGFIIKGSANHGMGRRHTHKACNQDTPCCGRETRCEKPPCS